MRGSIAINEAWTDPGATLPPFARTASSFVTCSLTACEAARCRFRSNFTSGPFAFSPRSAVIGVTNNTQLYGADFDGRFELGALFFMDHLNLLADSPLKYVKAGDE